MMRASGIELGACSDDVFLPLGVDDARASLFLGNVSLQRDGRLSGSFSLSGMTVVFSDHDVFLISLAPLPVR
jgi:hypothetical protein